MIKILKPSIKYKTQICTFIDSWEEDDFNDHPLFQTMLTFNQYLKQIDTLEKNRINPMLYYFVLEQNELIGFLELRLAQNEFNHYYAGHLGYGVHPSKRNQGYGNLILKKGIQELKKFKVQPIYLTCDTTHLISKKMFTKINAHYIEDYQVDNEQKSIYKI